MSVILDALKKLERDKAACRKGPVDIVPQITIPRNRGARTANWKIPAIIIGAVTVTAAATAFIVITVARQGTRPVTAVSMDEEYARPAPSSEPASVRPALQNTSGTSAGRFAAEAAKVPRAGGPTARPAEDSQPRTPSHEPEQPVEKKDDVAIITGGASSDLKVSGIAWQDERADRRAVVNGALVGEGAVVEGARIVRIYHDRVRFSRGGDTFEKAVEGGSGAK